LLVLFFCGCKKKEHGNVIGGVYLIPQEFKDYTLFLPGTYWIYQDSITGNEDSEYVINNSMGKDTFDLNPDAEGDEVVEYFQYDVRSSFQNGDGYRYDCNTSFYKCVERQQAEPCFFLNRGNQSGSGFCFAYEFYDGFWFYCGYANKYSKITTIKHWPSLKLNNVQYNFIVEFYDDKNITEKSNKTNIFFTKNVGIVRKELLDSNQTWNLIRSNIVQ
jgi:hypothetical protein